MAESVEFRSNGSLSSGYLVKPSAGSGPGVLVIQQWWGLDSGIMGPHNALGTLDATLAAQIWPAVVSFLKENVR